MIRLKCDYHPGAPDDATIHHAREILSSGTHVSSSQKRKGVKSFLAESREKNRNYLFYPSAKSRRELKIKTLGVTFGGASAYYVQKSIAPQKQAVCRFSDDFFFSTKEKSICGEKYSAPPLGVGNMLGSEVGPKFCRFYSRCRFRRRSVLWPACVPRDCSCRWLGHGLCVFPTSFFYLV